MRRRSFYVAIAVAYAVAVYVALAAARSRGEDVEVLILVIAVSVAAGTVAWRFTSGMQAALRETERGREELAIIGRLSAGLSGPLSPREVATSFLDGIKTELPPTTAATLLQYEETAGHVRALARQGGAPSPDDEVIYPIGALPAALRTKLIGEHRSFVLPDVATDPDWPAFVAAIPV